MTQDEANALGVTHTPQFPDWDRRNRLLSAYYRRVYGSTNILVPHVNPAPLQLPANQFSAPLHPFLRPAINGVNPAPKNNKYSEMLQRLSQALLRRNNDGIS